MALHGELTACGLCSTTWKRGGIGGWGLGRESTGIPILKSVHKSSKLQLLPVKSALRAESSVRNGLLVHMGFGAGDVRWVDPGSGLISSGRPATFLEAGRSKAKKDQTSGGRIERRPVSTRRPKLSNPGEGQERTPVGEEGSNQGEQQGREAVGGRSEGRGDGRRMAEEELNSTWQELGLRDRRSGGKFLPGRGPPQKEATRVGGWGRDKSMQRVITPEEQRANRGRRERIRSGVRQKTEASGAPVVKPKKKKWDADFDPDPKIRHPPDYYKYGPYGPYSWRGMTVGKIVEGDWDTNQVVYFSNVKDDAEAEDRERANVTVDYTEAVAALDTEVGIQYFYAFARRRYGPRPDPWADWTLVAQIAVESGEDLGGNEIFPKMGSKAHDVTVQCVAWARPDLTYVKKASFQMRLEPQEDFLKELFDLLDPTTDGNDPNSYYATLCRLVNVDLDASAERVRNGYEALKEEDKMECLKHVFTNHPVKVLSSKRYERQIRGEREKLLLEVGNPGLPSEEEADDESNGPADEEEYDQAGEDSEFGDEDLEGSMETRGIGESDSGNTRQQGGSDGSASNARRFSPKDGRRPGMRKKRQYQRQEVKSAIRPYSYSNVIEEIAEIRIYFCGKRSLVSVN